MLVFRMSLCPFVRSRLLILILQEEQREISPQRVAERFRLDIADVYEALAYFYRHPEEMQRVKERHKRATAEAQDQSSISPLDS